MSNCKYYNNYYVLTGMYFGYMGHKKYLIFTM